MAVAKRIIPCLDVDGGSVVKGINFKGLKGAGDPVELASRYRDQGADELVFLDITATVEARRIMFDVVKDVAKVLDIPFTVGGGIRTFEDARAILWSGADKVSINTVAVQDPSVITKLSDAYGSQCIVLAVDAKWVSNDKRGGNYQVYTHGGRVNSGLDVINWIRKGVELGAGEVLLTSIDRDGTQSGYDIELTKKVTGAVEAPVIASGGCGSPEHILDVLKAGNADAALAASIFHYGKYTPEEVKLYLKNRGLIVRA